MKLFDNYSDGIAKILSKKETLDILASSDIRSLSDWDQVPRYINRANIQKAQIQENLELEQANKTNKVLINFDKSQLVDLFGTNLHSFSEQKIGTHPDFEYLSHYEYENHFCVSMFMDIKGSTRLNEKYSLLEIRKIKDTILTLAIHVSSHFGGHVHRLQGDGIFLQFVRKNQLEQNAVINALNAASVLTYFMTNDLAKTFESNGVKPLRIRIGIDLGFKNDVIWSHYGVPGCSELTTTSLHTDLAAKLQAAAPTNGILVGGNVKEVLDIKSDFCENILNNDQTVDYYIYQGSQSYRKFNFNWLNYLKSFDFTRKAIDLNTLEIYTPEYRLKCFLNTEHGEIEYYQNSYAIDKDVSIRFEIQANNKKYFKTSYDKIRWKAHNSGSQAKEKQMETHDFGGDYNDNVICRTTAAFTGHHYVECLIKRVRYSDIKITFPIFIQ